MDVLRFRLSGSWAFFKKPDVNLNYFTYGNIHKVALMGMLGAIAGYGGYNQQQEGDCYPEFYERLKDIRLGIVPLNNQGYIKKKFQSFNNSVGYASGENGGNLIVNEQWLESPSWDIYVAVDKSTRNICDQIMEKKACYLPYLGKNDHMANIDDIFLLKGCSEAKEYDRVDSLFLEKHFNLKTEESPDILDFKASESDVKFKYQEKLPIAIDESMNNYILDKFIYTNYSVEESGLTADLYRVDGKVILFF